MAMHDEIAGVASIWILIDGSHVDRLKSKLNRRLDFERLVSHFATQGRTAKAVYYRDCRDDAELSRHGRFFDWLDRHGIERRGSDDFKEPWYIRERYGSNLVLLASDAMRAACNGDALVVLAGDAKLIPLFENLHDMNVPVTLISSRMVPDSIAPPPPLIELAHAFIDLAEDDRFFLSNGLADRAR